MHKIYHIFLLLFGFTCYATSYATICPKPNQIKHKSGTNEWTVSRRGWIAFTELPLPGMSQSHQVADFDHVDWIQLNNEQDSLGLIHCYYRTENTSETLIAMQVENIDSYTSLAGLTRQHQAQSLALKPGNPSSIYWTCQPTYAFPATACQCSDSPGQCQFDWLEAPAR